MFTPKKKNDSSKNTNLYQNLNYAIEAALWDSM